jgi:arsenate reductase (glutaredoxin)
LRSAQWQFGFEQGCTPWMVAMTVTVFGIPNCDTVKKSRQWLNVAGVDYVFHDYKKLGIDDVTLNRWADAVGWESLINRAGTTFKKLDEADKTDINRAKAIALMIANPSMIKRPVVEGTGTLLVGFRPDDWNASFG